MNAIVQQRQARRTFFSPQNVCHCEGEKEESAVENQCKNQWGPSVRANTQTLTPIEVKRKPDCMKVLWKLCLWHLVQQTIDRALCLEIIWYKTLENGVQSTYKYCKTVYDFWFDFFVRMLQHKYAERCEIGQKLNTRHHVIIHQYELYG